MSLNNWVNRNILNESTSQYIEEARGKKIADPLRAKLMGMEDIRSLKGTMTPRYFATKVIRLLQKENPEMDIEDLTDEDIQKAINVVANVSKPLATRSDIKITTRERGAADAGLKRGDTGFETLQLNLGSDTVLKSEGEVGVNDLYTVVKDGLKYRVTLNNFKGTKVNLDDITQGDVVSVVIVKPSETETVDKFAGEIDLGQREKLVADYPEGESEVVPAEDAEIDKEKADLNDDGELSEYERKRGQAIADAMEKEEDEDESELSIATDLHDKFYELMDSGNKNAAKQVLMQIYDYNPDTYKELYKVYKGEDNKEEESTCDEENEEIAMSPQQINQAMIERGRQEMHRHHQIERMFRHGY